MRRTRFLPAAALSLTLLFSACASEDQAPASETAAAGEEQVLFDGQSLEGWRRHDGLPEAQLGGKWEVVDGAIVGDQDPPGHGGFLITTEKYKNYILTLETKLDYPIDSGIFLRVGEDGKSHQVTLDYRPDGSVGAIYLPWTQGMVQEKPESLGYLKRDEWNELKVQIEGEPSRIQFWVNGEKVTDFQHTAETTQGVPEEGYIGLQVHPGDSYEAGKKVRFRNIRIQPLP